MIAHKEETLAWTEIKGYKREWEDPWAKCPQNMQHSTAMLEFALPQFKGKARCAATQTLELGIVDRKDIKPEKQDYCIRKTVDLWCRPGEVLFKVRSIGRQQSDAEWHCPAGYYSNIPGDSKFSPECTC